MAPVAELEAEDAKLRGDDGEGVAARRAHVNDVATPDGRAARAEEARKPALREAEDEQHETTESDAAGEDTLVAGGEGDAGADEDEENTEQDEDLDARERRLDATLLGLARTIEGADTVTDALSRLRAIHVAENLFDLPFVSIGHKGPPAGAVSPSTMTARGWRIPPCHSITHPWAFSQLLPWADIIQRRPASREGMRCSDSDAARR